MSERVFVKQGSISEGGGQLTLDEEQAISWALKGETVHVYNLGDPDNVVTRDSLIDLLDGGDDE